MNVRKLVLALALVAGAAVAALSLSPAQAAGGACDNVRCAACPDGTHWAPIPSNCCRCLPN